MKDQFGRLWLKTDTGLQMTLGNENDKRRSNRFTYYAQSCN